VWESLGGGATPSVCSRLQVYHIRTIIFGYCTFFWPILRAIVLVDWLI